MKKDFIICICAIVIGCCGWIGGKQYDHYEARRFLREQAAAAVVADRQRAAEKNRLVRDNQVKAQHAAEVKMSEKKGLLAAQRQRVESELAGCKLSSIMLGAPSIAIIDKKGYEAGGEVRLASGRVLVVRSIEPDAVQLSDEDQIYRLALPGARDLGGSAR